MHYVQLVLDNPGKDVMVEDHHHTIEADRDLFGLVLNVLKTLRVDIRHDASTMSITSIDGSFRLISYPSAELCLGATADEEHENYRRRSLRNPNAIY
jgi:hypothetical protein